jgi:Spy/CpxP family protein refolding chaperone
MWARMLTTGAVAACVAVMLQCANAQQDGQDRGNRQRGFQGQQGPGGFQGQGGFQGRGGGGMAVLDEQQRNLLREALQKEQDPLRALDEKLRAAQKELMQAVLAEKYDEQVVRQKAEAVAKIEVEMTLLRAKALATVAPTLKTEQKESMINSPFGAMMLRGGMMMDRGGGGPVEQPQDRGNRGDRQQRQDRPR